MSASTPGEDQGKLTHHETAILFRCALGHEGRGDVADETDTDSGDDSTRIDHTQTGHRATRLQRPSEQEKKAGDHEEVASTQVLRDQQWGETTNDGSGIQERHDRAGSVGKFGGAGV